MRTSSVPGGVPRIGKAQLRIGFPTEPLAHSPPGAGSPGLVTAPGPTGAALGLVALLGEAGVGVEACAEVGRDVAVGVADGGTLGVGIGFRVGVGAGVGVGTGVGAGVGFGDGVGVGVGVADGFGVGVGAGVGCGVGVGVGCTVGVGFAAETIGAPGSATPSTAVASSREVSRSANRFVGGISTRGGEESPHTLRGASRQRRWPIGTRRGSRSTMKP